MLRKIEVLAWKLAYRDKAWKWADAWREISAKYPTADREAACRAYADRLVEVTTSTRSRLHGP